MTVLTLVAKPDCHLCEDAKVVIASVLSDFNPDRVSLEERSIFDDPALLAEYAEEIPVVLIDGRVHSIWRVDASRLRSALKEAVQ